MPTWDGYFFIAGDESYDLADAYLLDGYTGEKIPYTLPEDHRLVYFLTNELVYISYLLGESRPAEIHHRTENWAMPIEQMRGSIPPPFLEDGTPNPDLIFLLEESERVFVVRYAAPFIIVLGANAPDEVESSFILSGASYSRDLGAQWPVQFLETSGLAHISIPPLEWRRLPPYRMPSPNGRFVATGRGIYDSVTDQKMVSLSLPYPYDYRLCCWYPSSDAVIYMPPDFHLTTWGLASPEYERFERLVMGFPLQMEARSAPILKIHIPERYRQNSAEK